MTELVNLFANAALIRILDFLLDHPDQDFCRADIVRLIGISRATVDRAWVKLFEYNVVNHTRTIERSMMYCLNTESPLVQALNDLDRVLVMDKIGPDSLQDATTD